MFIVQLYVAAVLVTFSGSWLMADGFMQKQRGIPYAVIRPLTYGVDFYGDCLFTSEAEIREYGMTDLDNLANRQ